MKRTTDSHGRKVAALNDIKEVSKRTQQLAEVALAVCFITLLMYLYYALYISAIIIGVLIVFVALGIWVMRMGYRRFAKPVILSMIMLGVFLLAFVEGLAAGGYLYFIPILFALPLLTESNKPYKKELLFYFTINSAFFCVCVFFFPMKPTWQHITEQMYKSMFHLNTTSAMLVSIVFVYFSFYFEKKFAAALVSQISKAEYAMHTRTIFLSNMGHELRTPLNGISGIISLLKKERLSTSQQEYLNLLKYCSDQMLGLVNDVLDFNKIEAGKLELHPIVFNLRQGLQQAVLPFYYRFEEKNVALKVQFDNDLDVMILADDLRLVQVINNLLSNALKFTEAGQVKLTAECLNKNSKSINVRFSVQDSGIGIDEQYQKKIFETFGQVINHDTRKQQGAGLGLTISQRLLELMNSKLQVISRPGQGSNFYFTCLFNRVSNTAVPETKDKENKYSLEGMRVLVVEDNPINLMIVSKLLKDWKVQVDTAVNGIFGLDALASNPRYDLILLDLQMPEMDGYEAVVEIKKRHQNLPVFAFTASLVNDVMKNELLTLGFDGYITKPFKPAELYEKIKGFCAANSKIAERPKAI